MNVLGAVLAGGHSLRFGSDKALAEWRGLPLIEHALRALARHSDSVIVCGRRWKGAAAISDAPRPGLGPLGGLNAALNHAVRLGYDRVLTIPCDAPTCPDTLLNRLVKTKEATIVRGMPVVGVWPSSLSGALDQHLRHDSGRSMRGWAEAAGAMTIDAELIPNVNYRADLDALGD